MNEMMDGSDRRRSEESERERETMESDGTRCKSQARVRRRGAHDRRSTQKPTHTDKKGVESTTEVGRISWKEESGVIACDGATDINV